MKSSALPLSYITIVDPPGVEPGSSHVFCYDLHMLVFADEASFQLNRCDSDRPAPFAVFELGLTSSGLHSNYPAGRPLSCLRELFATVVGSCHGALF